MNSDTVIGAIAAVIAACVFALGYAQASSDIADRCDLTNQIVLHKRVFACVELKK